MYCHTKLTNLRGCKPRHKLLLCPHPCQVMSSQATDCIPNPTSPPLSGQGSSEPLYSTRYNPCRESNFCKAPQHRYVIQQHTFLIHTSVRYTVVKNLKLPSLLTVLVCLLKVNAACQKTEDPARFGEALLVSARFGERRDEKRRGGSLFLRESHSVPSYPRPGHTDLAASPRRDPISLSSRNLG